MDINHPPREAGDHAGRDPLEVPGQHYEPGVAESGGERGRIGGVREYVSLDPRPPRPLERSGVGAAGDDPGDARRPRIRERVEQCLQVRATARDEHGDANRGGRGGRVGRHRGQGLSDLGFAPAATASAKRPVANFSLLVTTMV